MNKILITGARRSGTTFLGQILGKANNTGYLFEPLNTEVGIKGLSINDWYPNFTSDNIKKEDSKVLENFFEKLNGSYKVSLGDSKTNNFIYDCKKIDLLKNLFTNVSNEKLLKRFFRVIFKNRGSYEFLKVKLYKWKIKNLVFKDPLAALSSDFLSTKFNMKVIVILRHPASYFYSMKKQNWGMSPENFLNQNIQIDKFIKNTNELKTREDFSLLEYCIIYQELLKNVKNNKNFILVRHEDICLNPILEIEKIFNLCNLDFSQNVKKIILDYTGDKNVKDTNIKNKTKRDSKEIINSWKKKLSKDDIKKIKYFTFELIKDHYPESEWI